ncbi:complement c1q-like protein 3 [Plakobranchus ocellatus]|uniref:Complement c1q-like protein 3 n=1 Tax=Plakobranchus ocellatus TaxID=259542 RepID=A0AAV4D056_9GAST|nr:complement c1q-like protein 3 [Plakobranchus ocellatus]
MRQRIILKTMVDDVLSELEVLGSIMASLNRSKQERHGSSKKSVSFSAKLSYNRELQPFDTIEFDSVLTNIGEAYNPDTGRFTVPLDGTYLFHSTILSGYNTKIEPFHSHPAGRSLSPVVFLAKKRACRKIAQPGK